MMSSSSRLIHPPICRHAYLAGVLDAGREAEEGVDGRTARVQGGNPCGSEHDIVQGDVVA